MTHLADTIPDPDVLLAFEPEELGLRVLPILADWPRGEMLELGRFLTRTLGPSNIPGQGPSSQHPPYPHARRHELEQAIAEAWAWLEGAALLIPARGHVGHHEVRVLSRKARQLAKENNPAQTYTSRRLAKDSLHEAIREDVWSLYHRGKYDTAVFEAMKAVEVAVREGADLSDKDLGVHLMRKAFDKNTGPLTDRAMEEGEREARAHLFAGAIGSYKNPHSHRNVALDDPNEAAEIIMLANHLLRIVYDRAGFA
jgi:uncharacterized protein (TIGR02391 family)